MLSTVSPPHLVEVFRTELAMLLGGKEVYVYLELGDIDETVSTPPTRQRTQPLSLTSVSCICGNQFSEPAAA